MQSLNNKDLKLLGRDHNKDQALEAVEIVRKWFKNFNLDFIYGRQYQNTNMWEDELSKIISLEAPHYLFINLP